MFRYAIVKLNEGNHVWYDVVDTESPSCPVEATFSTREDAEYHIDELHGHRQDGPSYDTRAGWEPSVGVDD